MGTPSRGAHLRRASGRPSRRGSGCRPESRRRRRNRIEPSATRSRCAYKGEASYSSVRMPDRLERDIAWRHNDQLDDATRVGGHVAFFDERVDTVVDGVARARPVTPWSRARD
ncbi:DUF427 domain-containing protein [Lacisediminihabitans sp.]|uniref:DUF427 domain-containing protein n=1 Tax=Lacisediminihabitans sp. TaxID=2787631 RepID=UPI002F927923